MTDPSRRNYLILNRQRKHPIDAPGIRRFLGALALHMGQPDASFSVVLITDAAMRVYNRQYRGYDKPTDVLSFEGEGDYLGDILISTETAYRQAAQSPTLKFATNINRLLLHGFLHLNGYDHGSDNGEMRTLERRLRRQFQC